MAGTVPVPQHPDCPKYEKTQVIKPREPWREPDQSQHDRTEHQHNGEEESVQEKGAKALPRPRKIEAGCTTFHPNPPL